MLSKSTTRKPMLSKSLCHVQNHTFGLVPTNRYFHDSNKSDFCSKPPESLYLQASYYPYSFTLVINTTVSTWNDRSILMSDYWPVTVNRQKSAPFVRGNISTRVFSLISSGFPIDLFPRTDMLFRFIRTYPMYTNTRKRSFYQHFSIS